MEDITTFVIRQWQGAGQPHSLVESIDLISESTRRPVVVISSNQLPSQTRNNVHHFSAILENLDMQLKSFTKENPVKALVLACECSGEIVPVSHFIKKYEHDLVVLWIDAHGDLNTPASSPSGNYHGMPLRTLIGDGPREIVESIGVKLSPEKIGLLGTRDLDDCEVKFIEDHGVRLWRDLNSIALDEIIEFTKDRKVYVHFDLDAINPEDISLALYKTPGGPMLEEILSIIDEVSMVSSIVEIGITEYNDQEESRVRVVREIVDKCIYCMNISPLTSRST